MNGCAELLRSGADPGTAAMQLAVHSGVGEQADTSLLEETGQADGRSVR